MADPALDAVARAISERRLDQAHAGFAALPSAIRAQGPGRRLAGQLAWGSGDYPSAVEHFEAACRLAPADPDAQLALARARVGLGEVASAIAQLERFIAASGFEPGLRPMLELLRFDDSRPQASLAPLEASRTPASDPHAYLQWRALRVLAGQEPAAAIDLPHPRAQAIWNGFLYQARHRPPARLVGSAPQVMDLAIDAAPPAGLVIECGVFHGRSLQYLARRLPDAELHGFDSFEGLPEDWLPGEPAGSYSTGGVLPRLPPRVRLHRGWFRDTLPGFVADHPGEPIRLLHVDCDLYSSTVDVLAALGGGLQPGSVLVFDDYLGFPGAEAHEFRAFAEFCAARGIRYRYLGFALMGREAALRIDAVGDA